MNHIVNKYILLLILVFSSACRIHGQMIDVRNIISFSVGNVSFQGKDNIFFPKNAGNGSLSLRADYLHTVLPWMKIGIEGSYIIPSSEGQGSTDFARISTVNENIFTAGFNSTIFLPYKQTGWRNRLRIQIGLAPVAVIHTGERNVTINNNVLDIETNQSESGVILSLKSPATGFGFSITPTLEYYILQSIGLRFSYNSLITSFKSDLKYENLNISSFNLGIFIPLSKNNKLNY